MIDQTLQSKARRGIKDDSSLHEFEREISRRREALGLPPVDNDFDPSKIIAEWHREQGLTPPHARQPLRKKAKRRVQEFEIVISLAPQHGYWVYCPAVNGKSTHGETVVEAQKKMTAYLTDYLGKLAAQGKPLPKTGVRIKKIKIAAPTLA